MQQGLGQATAAGRSSTVCPRGQGPPSLRPAPGAGLLAAPFGISSTAQAALRLRSQLPGTPWHWLPWAGGTAPAAGDCGAGARGRGSPALLWRVCIFSLLLCATGSEEKANSHLGLPGLGPGPALPHAPVHCSLTHMGQDRSCCVCLPVPHRHRPAPSPRPSRWCCPLPQIQSGEGTPSPSGASLLHGALPL